MNKLEILNELRRCVEPTQEGWDVWFHGAYLGTIVKTLSGADYYILREKDATTPIGIRKNYMSAIACFLDHAVEVYQDDYKELQESQPVLRSYGRGIRIKKSRWIDIVKGWFK